MSLSKLLIHSFISVGILSLLILNTNCNSDRSSQDFNNIQRVAIDSLNLFLSPTTNKEISSPSFMDILPDGRLAVLDTEKFQVFLLNNDGSVEKTFGRRGKGPGEFVAPRGINVRDTIINIIDVSLKRANQYDLDGNFIQNYPLERETSHFGFVTAGKNMEFYSVANGYNGKLVGHHNAATDSSRYFGEAPVNNPPPVSNQKAFRSSASNGKVPKAIRNDIWMNYHKGDLYIFLKNLSRLQKYTDGKLQWDKELWMPANDFIFDHFAESASQSGFSVLRYISDMATTDDYIYLLWNRTPDHPQKIVQVNTQGKVQKIFDLKNHEGIGSLAVDPKNNRIYLTDIGAAEIYTINAEI